MTKAVPRLKKVVKSIKSSGVISEQTHTVTDRSQESQLIEQELSLHYLGTIKIFPNQVTSKWRESLISNRGLDEAAVKKLVAAFEESLGRVNPTHHMVVTIPEEHVAKFLQALNLTMRELREMSSASNWPLITKEIWMKFNCCAFTLQAGQHRPRLLSDA